MFDYEPTGVCATRIRFDINNGKIHSLSFEDGCDGNLKALGILLEGMDAGEAVEKLKGIDCDDRGTSCADQLALAILKYL